MKKEVLWTHVVAFLAGATLIVCGYEVLGAGIIAYLIGFQDGKAAAPAPRET